jgi:hypothetical protein
MSGAGARLDGLGCKPRGERERCPSPSRRADEANAPIRFRSLQLAVRATVARQAQDGTQPAIGTGRRGGRHRDDSPMPIRAAPAFPKLVIPGLADLDATTIEVVWLMPRPIRASSAAPRILRPQ